MTLQHLASAIFLTGRISIPTVLDSVLHRLTPEECDRRLDGWARQLLAAAKIDLHVEGSTELPAGEAFVVMSNHQSHYDIPTLLCALPLRVRMVAKEVLFKVPIWGPAMLAAGFIPIDRSNRKRAIDSLDKAKAALVGGTSIWIAPEGTRGPGGRNMLPFKKGGFYLAIETGARILPVSIDGTQHVLPSGGRTVAEGIRVRVTVHKPISPQDYAPEQRDQLIADVREAILSGLPER